MDCCRRILTRLTALGKMSTSIQRRLRFLVAMQAMEQSQREGG